MTDTYTDRYETDEPIAYEHVEGGIVIKQTPSTRTSRVFIHDDVRDEVADVLRGEE